MARDGQALAVRERAQLPTLSPSRQLAANGVPAPGRVAFGAVSRTGETALADDANHVVYRFSTAGTFRDSLGRLGSGPGEFRIFAGIAFGPHNEVAVADLSLRRVVTWSELGKPIDATPIDAGSPVGMTEWLQAPVVAVPDCQGTLRFVAVAPRAPAGEVARIPVGRSQRSMAIWGAASSVLPSRRPALSGGDR